MKTIMTSFLLAFITCLNAQKNEFTTQNVIISPLIEGTLLAPKTSSQTPLAILIADAGPTDRNGNQNFQKNNMLKKLAEELALHDVATFRYDKRTVKQIRRGQVDSKIRFDDFVSDAIAVIDYFKTQNNFTEIYIIGHGQGSLVGMLAAKKNIDGFISVAGSGKPIDEVILDQVAQMDSSLVKPARKAFVEIKAERLTRNYPQALNSVFSPDLQPFMRSWMAYHPSDQIRHLDIPILIVSGTKDLQVPVSEAELLYKNATNARLEIIENLNHVLFIIEGKTLENSKSYNESFRPISQILIQKIVAFIRDE